MSKKLMFWTVLSLIGVCGLVRIGEVVIQNPWWKHGEGFVRFDKNLQVVKINAL